MLDTKEIAERVEAAIAGLPAKVQFVFDFAQQRTGVRRAYIGMGEFLPSGSFYPGAMEIFQIANLRALFPFFPLTSRARAPLGGVRSGYNSAFGA